MVYIPVKDNRVKVLYPEPPIPGPAEDNTLEEA
jgi:hypothetical protein